MAKSSTLEGCFMTEKNVVTPREMLEKVVMNFSKKHKLSDTLYFNILLKVSDSKRVSKENIEVLFSWRHDVFTKEFRVNGSFLGLCLKHIMGCSILHV